MPEGRAPKVFFYAVNGLGLGHVTRLMAVARQLRRIATDVQIVFITSTEASQLLYQEGFTHFKLPSKNSASSSGLKKSELQLSYQMIIQSLYAILKPSLLVVDTFPVGLLHELFGILQLHHGIPKVLIQRNIKLERQEDITVRQQGFYQHIIVPHQEEEGPFATRDDIPATAVGPILIRNREEIFPREKALAILRQGCGYHDLSMQRKKIFVTMGGGGDVNLIPGVSIIGQIAERFPNYDFFIPRAPLARNLPAMPQTNIYFFQYYPILELLNAFDFAISSLGYNSFHELQFACMPALFFPQDRVFDDQAERGKTAADKGLCRYVPNLDTDLLAREITFLAEPANTDSLRQNMKKKCFDNGAILAAQILQRFLHFPDS